MCICNILVVEYNIKSNILICSFFRCNCVCLAVVNGNHVPHLLISMWAIFFLRFWPCICVTWQDKLLIFKDSLDYITHSIRSVFIYVTESLYLNSFLSGSDINDKLWLTRQTLSTIVLLTYNLVSYFINCNIIYVGMFI